MSQFNNTNIIENTPINKMHQKKSKVLDIFTLDNIRTNHSSDKVFFKITSDKPLSTDKLGQHFDNTYHTGLNICSIPFETKGSCVDGGIYFTDKDNILKFLFYGIYLRKVDLPLDDPAFIMVKDPDSCASSVKWRASRVILGNRLNLRDISTFKYLMSLGVDINVDNDKPLRWAASRGYYGLVKFLLDNGANVHAYDDEAVQLASRNGYLNVVKILVEHGANVNANNDYAIQMACKYGYNEIVRFLVYNGANPMANRYYPIEIATEFGNKLIVRFLLHQDKSMVYKSYAMDIAVRNENWDLLNVLLLD